MKKILVITFIAVALIITSCTPQTKESYLEDYKEFITNTDEESANYTDEDWIDVEEKYNKFNGEWYQKFEDELTWKEEIIITKYQFQFNLLKLKEDSKGIGDLFSKKDYTELKEQLKHYSENKMDSDITFIIEQAAEMGAAYAELVDSLLTDIDKAQVK